MPNSVTDLLAGIDKSTWIGKGPHVTLSVTAVSDGVEATVLLPDTTKLNIQLMGPVTLNVTKLIKFITDEALPLDAEAKQHLEAQKDEDVVIRCSAFYYEGADEGDDKQSTVLMMVSIEAKGSADIISGFFPPGGARDALTKFRDVLSLKRIALRLFRCPDEKKFEQLQSYVALLQPTSSALPQAAATKVSSTPPLVK